MRFFVIVSLFAFAAACDSKASPEKCLKVAEHVVGLSVKNAAGQVGADAGSARELLAGADAAKEIGEQMRNSPQFKQIQEGCQQVPESIADCMLSITDITEMAKCQPK